MPQNTMDSSENGRSSFLNTTDPNRYLYIPSDLRLSPRETLVKVMPAYHSLHDQSHHHQMREQSSEGDMEISELEELPEEVHTECANSAHQQADVTSSSDVSTQGQNTQRKLGEMGFGIVLGTMPPVPSYSSVPHLTLPDMTKQNVYIQHGGFPQPFQFQQSVLQHRPFVEGPAQQLNAYHFAPFSSVQQGMPVQDSGVVGSGLGVIQQMRPGDQTLVSSIPPGGPVVVESGPGLTMHHAMMRTNAASEQHPVAFSPVLHGIEQEVQGSNLQPGWIKQQLHSIHRLPGGMRSYQPRPIMLHSVGVRPSCPPQSAFIHRANAVGARFRSLYPMGYPSKSKGTGMPVLSPNMPIRFNPVHHECMVQYDSGHCGWRSSDSMSSCGASMEEDTCSSSYSHIPGSGLPMETLGAQVQSLADVHLQSADGIRSLRDIVTGFVEHTYSELGRQTYCIPQKAAVNQQHPDKALVRTREGEFRVSLSLEQLSIHCKEAMFILADYHYENFFYHLSPTTIIHPSDQQFVAETLTQLKKDRQFGDYDLLLFHEQYGLIVFGLCSVNSNSDVQYILKRVQKARNQLDKSVSVAQRYVNILSIQCQVRPILCTPNLKRSFLSKVTARDKATDRALSHIPILSSDQLPAQFRSRWCSQKAFEVFVQWWNTVKTDLQHNSSPLSQEQLTLLVGCFLCPTLSKVDFDQSNPPAPSERRSIFADSLQQPVSMEFSYGGEPTDHPKKDLDLSNLILSIGNINKPFSRFMDEYVDLYYPKFLTQTYRVPPIHFNIQKIVKEEWYEVLHMPMSKDTRGDEGENRVVSAIEILGLKYGVVHPVFIICDFQYNNYLNKLKETMFIKGDDRRPRRAYGQSVRAQHDCLLIHRRYGIIIVSVKAVGDNFQEWAQSGNEQWTAVKRTLAKVLKQLPREEKMVNMVLGDLISDLPCKKLIALPNLSRHDVNTAVSDDVQLQMDIQAMFPGLGTQAFLCKDELCETGESIWETLEQKPDFFPNLCSWWDRIVGPGQPGVLSEQLYKQIIGRFCGLLSTVEAWSVQTPRVEVRSLAEANQETAERFTRILLSPEQVQVLSLHSSLLFLWGPPGTGKTVILLLRAQRWVAEQGGVLILNLRHGSPGLPLGYLLQKQVQKMVGLQSTSHRQKVDGREGSPGQSSTVPTLASSSRSTTSPSASFPSSPQRAASPHLLGSVSPNYLASSDSRVQRLDYDSRTFSPQQPGQLADIPLDSCIIVDEVTANSHPVLSWIIEARRPQAIWCAGQFEEYGPPRFQKEHLKQVLRCTPMVQRVLKHTSHELGSAGKDMRGQSHQSYLRSYVPSSAPYGLATDGLRPEFIFHSRHNSSSPLPLECSQCGQDLVDIFLHDLHLQISFTDQAKRRKLGPLPVTGDSLSLKDVVIVSREVSSCSFVKAVKKGGFPVLVITDTANPTVAMPTQESVIFTTPFALTGLERKVVVYVAFQAKDPLGWEKTGTKPMDDLKVSQALHQLTAEDQVSLWYTASRCMGQLIIIVP